MSQPTALLVSTSPPLVEGVRGLASSVPLIRVEVCPDPGKARVRVRHPDVGLLLAHCAPGGESDVLDLLRAIASGRRLCPTLVLLGPHPPDQASSFLRAGAADCLEVPADLPRLPGLLASLTRPPHVCPPPEDPALTADLVAEGTGVLLDLIRRVAPQGTTLLLTGETGTGKTRLARLVHDLSPRRHEPFLTVDCGALSPALVESELFGHAKGAFTGADRDRAGKLAAAGRGTLLLDEVNSLPPHLQGKLLRAVDERSFEPVGSNASQPVRARLVVASNVPLEAEVSAGRFRADLFYRLNVVGFSLPPLRDRPAAVAPLARKFLAEFAGGGNRPDVLGFAPQALGALGGYSWPGNVRELRNVVERAVALCPGPLVEPADLPEAIRGLGSAPNLSPGLAVSVPVLGPGGRAEEPPHGPRNSQVRAAPGPKACRLTPNQGPRTCTPRGISDTGLAG